MTSRNPYLDILRCFAITSVVFFHYEGDISFFPTFIAEWRATLWSGVDLFFVLSGYLIAEQWFKGLAENQPRLIFKFYVKRALRILPSYFLVLALYSAQAYFLTKKQIPFWEFIFFVQNFGTPSMFVHSWSLCVEEHFYLIFPTLSLIAIKLFSNINLFKLLISLLVLPLATRLLLLSTFPVESDERLWEQVFYYPSYARFEGILFGVLIAYAKVYYPDLFMRARRFRIHLLVGGSTVVTMTWALLIWHSRQQLHEFKFIYSFSLLALGFAMLSLGVLCLNFTKKSWHRPFTLLSELSFSLYLIFHLNQMLWSILVKKSNLSFGPVPAFAVVHVSLILFAWLMFKFWESPFHRLRSKIINKDLRSNEST